MTMKLLLVFCLFAVLQTQISATDVKRCNNGEPFPLAVRVEGCSIPPCDIIKGTNIVFEVDLVSYKYITHMTTKVRATAIGLTIPYELPPNVANVCANLMYGAYCPLYPTEDVTYLFIFPIGNYPEVSVRVEISIVDQDNDVTTCFQCDIKVKKGEVTPTIDGKIGNVTTIYQLDF